MPNTLGHFGVQGVATRVLVREADPGGMALGCVLPDVPWIGRRAVMALAPGVDAFDLRLYAAVQSSLLFSLLLAGALALLARRALHVAAILALNCLLHLLLDACEKKWGNGVMLGAPFDWTVWNAGFFWAEEWPTLLLTLLGLGWIAWAWRRAGGGFARPPAPRLAACAALLGAWALVPLALIDDAGAAGVHFVEVLREPEPGDAVELDRDDLVYGDEGPRIGTWARTSLETDLKDHPARADVVSVKGRFREGPVLEVDRIHHHGGRGRDVGSYVGLALLAALWVRGLRNR